VPPETDPVVAGLTQLANLVQAAHERRAREHGVSPTLARLLRLLRERTPTMNELAALLGLDKSSTSGLVDRAQHRGLVRRVPSQLDHRSVRVRLTDSGSELAGALSGRLAEDVGAMLEPLSAHDRRALAQSLSTVLAHR
jgi:DNA-binding MarR family transcriptional regulator